jgi:pimeloyl-ACP methyl ester carboxylesterase
MPFVNTYRGKFYVEDWGGLGSVVCLLHGLTSQNADWNEIAPKLVEAGFHVIGHYMRGHGKSDKPETGYSPGDLADDLTAILQSMNIPKAHVVGHSTGGRNALFFAVMHPGQTLSLTIIDQTLTADQVRWKEAEQEFEEYPTPFADEASLDQFLTERYPDRPKRAAFEKGQFEKKPTGGWDWIFSVPAVLQIHRLGRAKELSPLLKKAVCPILFIKGGDSSYVSPGETEKIKKLIQKGSLVTVEKAKHGVFRDNPAEFLKVLLDFLAHKGKEKAHPPRRREDAK